MARSTVLIAWLVSVVVVVFSLLVVRFLFNEERRAKRERRTIVEEKNDEIEDMVEEETSFIAPLAVYSSEVAAVYEGLDTSEAWLEMNKPRTELLRRGSPLYGVSRYPPSFLRFSKRLRERNSCAAAFASGYQVRYWEAPTRDGGVSCRRFSIGNHLKKHKEPFENYTLDAAHPQLQDATDGSNMVDAARLRIAAGPSLRYLQAATLDRTVTPEVLAAALASCKNLVSCCLTECRVDTAVLGALSRTTLRALRLSMCIGVNDASLAAALRGATALKYLDIEASGDNQPSLPGAASAHLLRFSGLILLRLSDRGCGLPGLVDYSRLGHLALRSPSGIQETSITSTLTTLHIEHRFRERTPPALPALVQAIGRCKRLSDIDGFRLPTTLPSATVASRLNRLLVSPHDLRRLANASTSTHKSWTNLRELLVVATSDSTSRSLGPLDLKLIALFKALGLRLTSLIVRIHCQPGQLSDIFPLLPHLRHCSLANALTDQKSIKNAKASELEDVQGLHDADLRFLARHCPQLRVLDLSNTSDASAVFSEAAVENLVDRLQHLTDLYLYECGNTFNYRSIPTKGGRVAIHYACSSPASPTATAPRRSHSTKTANGASSSSAPASGTTSSQRKKTTASMSSVPT